jgi:ribosomal protein S18 acetylase RimI-like enzyme
MTKQHLLKNSMDVQIKRLASGDELILERVAVDVFDEAIDFKRLRLYLAEPNHCMMVAIQADEVVGQIRAVIHKHPDRPDELYIDNLGVTPTLQRQGIATKLLDAMLGLGRGLGCEEAWLATESNNSQAKGFYESYGVKAEAMVFYLFKL